MFGPRDHRELAPRLGLQADASWTTAGRELLARLRAALDVAFPAGSWREQPALEAPWGLVAAGPARCGRATLGELSARAVRLARGLGLTPARLEHPRELALPGAATEGGFARAPQARGDLRWQALDRWGTPLALLAAQPRDSAPQDSPSSSRAPSSPAARSAGAELSFRSATAPTLLARLLEQGPWPIWLAPESARVLRLPDDDAELTSDLRAAGLRVGEDAAGGPLAGRVRRAIEERVPVVVVAGPRERRAGQVTLRHRGELHTLPRAAASAWLRAASRPMAAPSQLTQRAPEWSASNSGPPRQAHFSTSTGGNSHSAP